MTRLGAVILACLVGFVVLAAPSRALADDASNGAVGNDLRAEAQVHYDRAKHFFTDGDFIAAAVEFRQAEVLLAPVAVNPDGSVKDKDAWDLRRRALSNEATSYSQANLPVDALDAFIALRDQFAAELAAAEREQIDAAIVKLNERIGTVELHGLPREATARIDGRAVPPEAGLQAFRVAAGEHELLVEGKAYKPFEKPFSVVARTPTVVDIVMAPSDAPARVRVESTVEPAEVTIDGEKRGPAPVEIEIKPGSHTFKVTSEQHRPMEGSFEVAPSERAIVTVALIPRRNPIGFRIESYFGMYVVNRDDTPIDRLALGFGLRLFHSAIRYAGLELGIDFAGYAREINRYSFGPVIDWCPDRFAMGTKGSTAQWCPVNVGLLKTTGGEIGPFTGGDNALRASTAFEARFTPIVIRLAAGLGVEQYKRSALVDLSAGITYFEFSFGFDL